MTRIRKILWLPILFLVASGLLFGCAAPQKPAATAKAEADWRFHDIVKIDFVKQYAVMPQPKDVMIIDSRPKRPKYDNGYIPTAVSIPDSQFEKITGMLPADKKSLLIFYCEGPT